MDALSGVALVFTDLLVVCEGPAYISSSSIVLDAEVSE